MNYANYVELLDVNFSFKPDTPFFQNISIVFSSQNINFVCGKNGVGKSTLLKILSGDSCVQNNVQGSLQIHDRSYDLSRPDIFSDQVGMVAQNFDAMLIHAYSFYENLQCAAMGRYPLLQKLPQLKPFPLFIEKYGIDFTMPIGLLSGGQRQILAILMVLQRCPRILLLDEPTAALDEENAAIVMDFLQELALQENITIIAIVHHHELVQKYAGPFYFELYKQGDLRCVRMALNEV